MQYKQVHLSKSGSFYVCSICGPDGPLFKPNEHSPDSMRSAFTAHVLASHPGIEPYGTILDQAETIDCLACAGTGKIGNPGSIAGGIDVHRHGTMTCSRCEGSGKIPVSEEDVAKVAALLPTHDTVELLMETGEFESSNIVHAALRVLQKRGKVIAKELFEKS